MRSWAVLLVMIFWLGGLRTASADITDRSPLPIAPKSSDRTAKKIGDSEKKSAARTSSGDWLTTAGGLVFVVGLILIFAKVIRKHTPAAQTTLPPEVVQILGRKMLDYRNVIHLVRCGSRLLVIGLSQQGMTTLAEITDPVEVDYLAGLCKPAETGTAASAFGQLFRRFQKDEPAETGESTVDPAVLRLKQRLDQSGHLLDSETPVSSNREAAG